MKQVKVNDILYVMDTEAYAITADTNVDIIYVPEDSYLDYVALNPTLELTRYNYRTIRVTKPEYDVPEPPTPSDSILIATYNVTDIGDEEESYPTKIYPYADYPDYHIYGVELFDKIEIDDVEVSVESLDENGGQYQFETIGEHTVKFTLKNPSVIPPFGGCDDLIGLVIPDSITSIGQAAFYGSSIRSITLPNTITSIGMQAFSNCRQLSSITIPNSVTEIGNVAFGYCSSLTSITIPSSVTTMGERVFDGCTALASVIVNCPTIGKQAFEKCSAITSVTFGNEVTNIGMYAFHKCSGLTSITLSNSVTNIGQHAFENCSNLSELTFGNSISNIDEFAFSECTSLTNVNIPNTITNIGSNGFGDCSSLMNVVINATTPPTIGSAFYNNAEGRKIYVPASSVDTYKTASTSWSSYADDILPIA